MPLASVTDPATLEGAVVAGVIVGLIVAMILGGFALIRRRSRSQTLASQPAGDANPYLADLVTGLRQAQMATRDAVEHFERYGVLVDPDYGTLEEGGGERLAEARRTVAEAEARLPRAELAIGRKRANPAHRCVEALRLALTRLRNYIEQPGRGETWSMEELDAAKDSLASANRAYDEFLADA